MVFINLLKRKYVSLLYLFKVSTLAILLSSCSFYKKNDLENKKEFKTVEDNNNSNCPKVKIPRETATYSIKNYGNTVIGTIEKISLRCKKIVGEGVNSGNENIFFFTINTKVQIKENIPLNSFNSFKYYIALIDSQANLIAKVLVPLKESDLLNKNKKFYIFASKNRFKFNDKNNAIDKIYFGFQLNKNNRFR